MCSCDFYGIHFSDCEDKMSGGEADQIKYAQQLREDGYIVIPPSSKKVRRIWKLEIITDPIGITFRWVK